MRTFNKIRAQKAKWRRTLLLIFLIVAVSIGYYIYAFVFWSNLRVVVPQKVFRSAQPSPAQLKKWARLYGIKTVINLRGYARKATNDEQAAADELGITLVTIRFKSTSLPMRDSLDKLIKTLETAEQPILIHCRSGVDRTGTASTLAAMAIGKENYDTAKWQAYVPPGPWKRNSTNDFAHISDMFKLYEMHRRENKTAGDWQDFKQWAASTDAFGDTDTKYRTDFSYLPYSENPRGLHPLSKLFRGVWQQFSVLLVILFLLAALMYKKLSPVKHYHR